MSALVFLSWAQASCGTETPRLTPARVDIRELTETEFLVGGMPFVQYLEAKGSDLGLRDDVEVWIGEQRAELVGPSTEGLRVRLATPLPVGQYSLRVSGPEQLFQAAALQVVDEMDAGAGDASVDAPRDAMFLDAGPLRDSGAPSDAASDASDAFVPDASMGRDFCGGEDLVACYEFESNGTDGSGSGNDLSLDEVTFESGVAGQALQLESGSSAVLHRASALNVSEFSIEFWMLAESLPRDGRRGLVDKHSQYGIFLQSDGTVRCTAGVGVAVSTLPIDTGMWTHIACSIGGGQLRIHRNGSQDSSAMTDGTVPTGSAAFHVGDDSPDGGEQFLGRLDGVRVWSRALSDAELCAAAAPACAP